MARYFGVAGIQMAVEPWNAAATVDKMREMWCCRSAAPSRG